MNSGALLRVEDIHTYYGSSHVLHGISLAVEPGTTVALMGRNGAGKTTIMRSIMGLTPPKHGSIRFRGDLITGQKTHAIARRGLALVPEARGIFPSLSVLEHLTIPARKGGAWDPARVFRAFPRLEERSANMGGNLSGGEQQMLAIARALVTNPALLLLDEPGEGLAPIIVQEIYRILRQLKSEGITMLLVEKNFGLATSVADFVYVIGKGTVRWSGPPTELRAAEDIKSTWLGV